MIYDLRLTIYKVYKVMVKLLLQGVGCVLGSVALWVVFIAVVASLDTCVDGHRVDPYGMEFELPTKEEAGEKLREPFNSLPPVCDESAMW